MSGVVRPIRFDAVRRERRNAKRRETAQRKKMERCRLSRAFHQMLWFGIEPEAVWLAGSLSETPQIAHLGNMSRRTMDVPEAKTQKSSRPGL